MATLVVVDGEGEDEDDDESLKDGDEDALFMRAYRRPRLSDRVSSAAGGGGAGGAGGEGTNENVKEEEDKWVVRLHLTSGKIYYTNMSDGGGDGNHGGTCQWTNPYEQQLEEKEEEEALEKQESVVAVRLLVGEEYQRLKSQDSGGSGSSGGVSGTSSLLVRDAGQGPAITTTEMKIQQDVNESHMFFEGPYARALLRFPEYIDPYRIHLPITPGVPDVPFQVSDKVRERKKRRNFFLIFLATKNFFIVLTLFVPSSSLFSLLPLSSLSLLSLLSLFSLFSSLLFSSGTYSCVLTTYWFKKN